MSLTLTAVIGILSLIVLLLLGVNIGMAMMTVGFVGYAAVVNTGAAIGLLRTIPAAQAASYTLTVIPLFIIMGNFAFAAGMSAGLYNAGNKWLSRLPGGLACATVAACAAFGAICGSTNATTATMGTVAIPEMRKYGYADRLSTGCVSVGGGLGIMIPPSSCMIIYGIAAEQSIGRLFAAGIIPGIVLAVILIITIVLQVKLNPSLAPPTVRYSLRERVASLKGLVDVLILFIGIFVLMFSGIFTINEAAAAGAFLAMVICLAERKLTLKMFKQVMFDSIKTTSMTYLIVIGAMVFGNFLAITRLPMDLAATIETLAVSRYVIFACIIVIYAMLGCFMDALPMIMLTVPIFLPVIVNLGFDPIWFGVIIIMVMMMGLITPPVGMNCYVMSGIAKDVPLSTIFRGAIPYTISLLIGIIVVTAVPGLATWLPTLIYG
ncbi:MAG: TRAP transporter large permease [Clostridiales Family XIII bacterium]|jgi:tripartite ATP-independent transporter DctM subunit|nr:TRAP transporter large permease [Clostridiales Family XIII bacterium]